MSIKIIEIFVKMREMFTDTLTLKLDIEEIKKKLMNHDKNIELVFSYLDELMEKQENPTPRRKIGFHLHDEETPPTPSTGLVIELAEIQGVPKGGGKGLQDWEI
jgi:hypothetical protein